MLDPVEVLPLGRCGWCHGRGMVPGELAYVPAQRFDENRHAPGLVPCGRCGGTGERGERLLASEHVLIDDDGRARPYRPGKDRRHLVPSIDRALPGRRPGEAAHRRHRCP